MTEVEPAGLTQCDTEIVESGANADDGDSRARVTATFPPVRPRLPGRRPAEALPQLADRLDEIGKASAMQVDARGRHRISRSAMPRSWPTSTHVAVDEGHQIEPRNAMPQAVGRPRRPSTARYRELGIAPRPVMRQVVAETAHEHVDPYDAHGVPASLVPSPWSAVGAGWRWPRAAAFDAPGFESGTTDRGTSGDVCRYAYAGSADVHDLVSDERGRCGEERHARTRRFGSTAADVLPSTASIGGTRLRSAGGDVFVKRSLPRPAKPRQGMPVPGPPCHATPRNRPAASRCPQAASGSSITFSTSNRP